MRGGVSGLQNFVLSSPLQGSDINMTSLNCVPSWEQTTTMPQLAAKFYIGLHGLLGILELYIFFSIDI